MLVIRKPHGFKRKEKQNSKPKIRHIDHRSGAPWGPRLCEGVKKNSRQSRENSFPGKGAPWGGPMWVPGAWASRTHGPQGPMGLKDPGLKDPGPHVGAPWGAQVTIFKTRRSFRPNQNTWMLMSRKQGVWEGPNCTKKSFYKLVLTRDPYLKIEIFEIQIQ